MQEHLVRAEWSWCRKTFIRLDFSVSLDEVGGFSLTKLWRAFIVVVKVWSQRLRGPIDVMYYPPCATRRIPMYRDFFILWLTRWCARSLIFQFHAGGFNRLRLQWPEKLLARFAYYEPDLGIVLLPSLAGEAMWIRPKSVVVIRNGIEDVVESVQSPTERDPSRILFVGTVTEQKGVLDALRACAILKRKGRQVSFRVVGVFASSEIEDRVKVEVEQLGLKGMISFVGQKNGKEKWKEYSEAGVFCFPTFETENLPVVLLEAMQFSLPIVTTAHRAIPDIISHEKEGLLVAPRSPSALADALDRILQDEQLRRSLGESGRHTYEQYYTLSQHLDAMEKALQGAFRGVVASTMDVHGVVS